MFLAYAVGQLIFGRDDDDAFRESVLFIGTQFSILYTSMYSPAEAATLFVLSETKNEF